MTERRRYAFVWNGRAGHGESAAVAGPVMARLRSLGHEVKAFPALASPATVAFTAARTGYSVVVAVGGDGTVSGCASAVWRHGNAVLGVLPAGTLNHFAKDLGVGLLPAAEEALVRGETRLVDLGLVNDHSFVNNAGIGLYPVIVRRRESNRRQGIPKWTAFILAILRVLFRLPLRRLELLADGQKISHRTPFLFVGNNRYEVEGAAIGTRKHLDAGVLGICASNAAGRWALIRLAARAVLSRIRADRDFLNLTVKELVVSSRHRTLQLSLDGELRRMHTPLRFETRPAALRVMAPGRKS